MPRANSSKPASGAEVLGRETLVSTAGGSSTFAGRAAAKVQGLARLMIETDAPYLTPAPHRGKPNEPAFLKHTAEFAATEVFGTSFEELAAITTANARLCSEWW